MAGHSKWANIKHRKASQDARRGKEFQKHIRAIMVAAKEGGADPALNIRLKAALERAKAVNVPSDNIEKAIRKGVGDVEGVSFEEITYEGYGSGGVAVLVEALTDNRNRTASEIRLLFSRAGGSLGESGCVSWLFERRGLVAVTGDSLEEEELLSHCIESGASDMQKIQGGFSVFCDPTDIGAVRDGLVSAGYVVESADIDMTPKTTVPITKKEDAEKIFRFMENLEDQDDVQNVYANFDIPDALMDELAQI